MEQPLANLLFRIQMMPTNDFRKDRFSFVSGTIIIWSVVLLKLWPFVAQYNTSLHITIGYRFSNEIHLNFITFAVLITLLAMGVFLLIFGVVYIISSGVLLSFPENLESDSFLYDLKSKISNFSSFIFTTLIRGWIGCIFFFIGYVIFSGIVYVVPEFFLNRLGIPTTYGRIICGFFFLFINLFIIYLLLAKTNLLDNFIDKFLKFEPKITSVYINLLVIIIFTLLLYFISIFCYTVSLKLDRIEFKKSETNYVNTILTLGGSTSDPRKAMLLLYNDQNELINYQPIRSLMGNKYVSTVNISNLKEGIYILKLLYPHYKLSANPPFIKSMIQEAKYFSIAP